MNACSRPRWWRRKIRAERSARCRHFDEVPEGKARDALVEDLAYVYYPALKGGTVRIEVHTIGKIGKIYKPIVTTSGDHRN